MGKITLYTAGRLEATADPLVEEGLLLPFGEVGRTNKGRLTAQAGVLKVADQLDPYTLDHDDDLQIGGFISIREAPEGFRATVRYSDMTAKKLAASRPGLSVEIDDLARTGAGPTVRDGKLVAGLITGGSQVKVPAFMSAKLAAADDVPAPDQGEAPTEDPVTTTTAVTDPPGGAEITTREETTVTSTVTDPPAVTTPATLQASELQPKKNDKLKASAQEVYELLAEYHRTKDAKLLAALADIVPANILGVEQPQFVGQLWSGKAYQRKIVPLFNHEDLTSFEVDGWRWKTKPEVGLYGGNKTAIPTNTPETEALKISAQRIAGGHDIDRKYRDFNVTAFWFAYFSAMTESYAKVSDAFGLSEVLDAAPYVEPGTLPDGVSKGLVYIVDGILAVLNATDTIADSAVISGDLWRDLVLTRKEDSLAYLDAALGFDEGTLAQRRFTIKPSAALAADAVLVACKPAVTVHELGGAAPIRVEAQDIAKGGIDEALFGYIAVNVHDAGGLALVSGTEPTP
jgi:hypothetical protein